MYILERVGVAALVLIGVSGAVVLLFPKEVHDAVISIELQKPPKSVKILFVGDMFFDRSVRTVADEKGMDFIFSCSAYRYAQFDAVVGNLEGPITNRKSVSVGSIPGSPENYVFTFPTSTAETLAKHNIKVVSLGNNHIGNMGAEGILSTRSHLRRAGVGYFGGLEGDEPVHFEKIGDIDFAFVSYNEFGGDSPAIVAEKIAAEKRDGKTVIVYAHWGEEYRETSEAMRSIAKIFVDAGADLILGAHPHVVYSREDIDGVPVFFSLGNFIFDQFWDERVSHGLAVEAEFTDGEIFFTEHQTTMHRDRRVCIGDDEPSEQ